MNFEWSSSNRKLTKTREAWESEFGDSGTRWIGFSLPQLFSEGGKVMCPYAGDCADVCYAAQSTYYMPHVKAKYERNYQAVERHRSKLADRIIEDLSSTVRMQRVTHVRLHDSGDFFARWYADAWLEVAKRIDDVYFYGYTKSLPLIDVSALPDNVKLVQSLGGKKDAMADLSLPHSRIFATSLDRMAAGYLDGNQNDLPVLMGVIKIGLVYHGSNPLTEAQAETLRK